MEVVKISATAIRDGQYLTTQNLITRFVYLLKSFQKKKNQPYPTPANIRQSEATIKTTRGLVIIISFYNQFTFSN